MNAERPLETDHDCRTGGYSGSEDAADVGQPAPIPSGSLRQRPGDQPLPVPNDGPPIHDLVVVDMLARRQLGTKRYGTPLQAHNGRNALQDAYEEALDLCAYLRQLIYEQEGR